MINPRMIGTFNTTSSKTGRIGAISATVGTYPGRAFLAADALHA